mmetsp:Transcript_18141/g.68759  ORF Transcript_18141/g.68759 Transcript_18141/m.68759 type:complete len:148 (+) Transcript_18141:118-561(+)
MRRRTAPAESGGDSAGPLQLKSVLNSVQNGVAGVLAGLQQDIGLPKEEEWKIRSWEEFFASFKSPTNLEERVRTNLLYYKANYVYVILPTACVVPLLMSPIGLVLLLAGKHMRVLHSRAPRLAVRSSDSRYRTVPRRECGVLDDQQP